MAMMTGILLCFNWVGLYYKAFKKIMLAESLLIDSYQPYFFEKKTKTLSTGELGLAPDPQFEPKRSAAYSQPQAKPQAQCVHPGL